MTGLRVLQATAWYPPHSLGGTEVYVAGLVAELAGLGVDSAVLAPRLAGAGEAYEHAGTTVATYPVNEMPQAGELKGTHPHAGFDAFRGLLLNNKSAIYHQHSWTRGCGPHHLRAAREAGLRTVLTVHVPGYTCLRGNMLRFGETACDGRVVPAVCGACWAEWRGMPNLAARALGYLPLGLATQARQRTGRLATVLSARALGAERLEHIAGMIANADRVVAVCRWLHDALLLNGVPAAKLVLNRQGVSGADLAAFGAVAAGRTQRGGPLRLLYLGRWDAAKGVDVVVRAVRALHEATPVSLTIHAVAAPATEREYEARVHTLADGDRRIAIRGPLARSDLAAAFAEHDVLVVPSIGLETGPLVVLEAQAAGLFVLGSRRGGIAELVDETDAGELVEAADVEAWALAIARLAAQHVRDGLPHPSRPVRGMAVAAADMAALYRAL